MQTKQQAVVPGFIFLNFRLQGSTGLLSQIENLLQLPTIDRIAGPPGAVEEQAKANRRQLVNIDAA